MDPTMRDNMVTVLPEKENMHRPWLRAHPRAGARGFMLPKYRRAFILICQECPRLRVTAVTSDGLWNAPAWRTPAQCKGHELSAFESNAMCVDSLLHIYSQSHTQVRQFA
jgi:hypothetical protein